MKNGTISSSIGIILAVILLTVTILIFSKVFASTQQTERSFDELISSINNLEEGGQNSILFALPKDYILVSFVQGKNLEVTSECPNLLDIKNPVSCGDYPCICICSTSWLAANSAACIKKEIKCHPFPASVTNITYDACSGGLYIEGTNNGIQTIYFKKANGSIDFCSSEDCTAAHEEVVAEEMQSSASDIFAR
jgi:hypothetical protein